MASVLVTGATGCIGSHLTRALVVNGEEVAIFRRPEDSLAEMADVAGQVEHRLGDIRDAEAVRAACRGVRFVYHLAGLPPSISSPGRSPRLVMEAVHVAGTENVARAALEAGVERLVHTSSCAAVGLPGPDVLADETFAFQAPPDDDYARTKRLGEDVVLDYARRGLDAVVVSPAIVLAPGNQLFARIIRSVQARRLRAYWEGGFAVVTRRDVIDGHLKAMAAGKVGERYILNTANTSFRDFLRLVANVVNVPEPTLRLPARALYAGGALLHGVAQLAGRTSTIDLVGLRALLNRQYYDQSKAVAALGLSQSSLVDAIREVAEWAEARAIPANVLGWRN